VRYDACRVGLYDYSERYAVWAFVKDEYCEYGFNFGLKMVSQYGVSGGQGANN